LECSRQRAFREFLSANGSRQTISRQTTLCCEPSIAHSTKVCNAYTLSLGKQLSKGIKNNPPARHCGPHRLGTMAPSDTQRGTHRSVASTVAVTTRLRWIRGASDQNPLAPIDTRQEARGRPAHRRRRSQHEEGATPRLAEEVMPPPL
jgi:hypothetical protein